MSWSDLFEPTIDMGKDDVELGDGLAAALHSRKELVFNSRELCDLFCNEERDDMKTADDVYVNSKLIHLLKKIQRDGVDVFYKLVLAYLSILGHSLCSVSLWVIASILLNMKC